MGVLEVPPQGGRDVEIADLVARRVAEDPNDAGLGLAVLPCLSADCDPDLIQLLPAAKVRSVKLWLVAHRDLVRTARVRAMMDFLADIVPKH